MKKFTYKVTCYVDVVAPTEEDAIDKAYDMFDSDIDINQITLYETGDDDHEWEVADNYYDEMRMSRFEDE